MKSLFRFFLVHIFTSQISVSVTCITRKGGIQRVYDLIKCIHSVDILLYFVAISFLKQYNKLSVVALNFQHFLLLVVGHRGRRLGCSAKLPSCNILDAHPRKNMRRGNSHYVDGMY